MVAAEEGGFGGGKSYIGFTGERKRLSAQSDGSPSIDTQCIDTELSVSTKQ